MTRKILARCLLFGICLGGAAAHADYIAGGVIIHTNPKNGSVRSSGDATVYDNYGQIVWNRFLNGYHNIYEYPYATAILAGRSIAGYGSVSNFASGYGVPGTSYAARLVAQSGWYFARPPLYMEWFGGPVTLTEPPDGPGCSATATNTLTAAFPLQDSPAGGAKLATAAVEFPLSRSEIRGQESFVMDEWAIVQDGQVRASSNPGFARAVVEQAAQKSLGSFLVIQEPVHDMNSRHVPKPEVRISRAGLRPSEKGAGEIVAARLEFSPSKLVDRVQIVYTSRPMDESRLERLVSQRVDLAFASDKGHRTAVYVVFRLTDRVEVLGTVTAFPKCCCGDIFCI